MSETSSEAAPPEAVSESSSEAAPPEAVTESNTKSNIIPSSEVTQPSSSAYKLISVKKTSKN